MDRIHLKSIIREHKLSATGMIDPKTARKLGKIAGVQALITSTVTPFGDNVRVTVKILDTETAKIIGASTANIAKFCSVSLVFDLLRKVILKEMMCMVVLDRPLVDDIYQYFLFINPKQKRQSLLVPVT